jgi:hypothetical protein
VKQAITQTLQVIAGYLSALFSPLRQRRASTRKGGIAVASRSNAGSSMDWQAWGTKRGLCWRATRDGLRHVPVGPPKSTPKESTSRVPFRDAREARFPARTATISVSVVPKGIPAKTARETGLATRNSVSDCARSAGAGKNALPLLARCWRGERAGERGRCSQN